MENYLIKLIEYYNNLYNINIIYNEFIYNYSFFNNTLEINYQIYMINYINSDESLVVFKLNSNILDMIKLQIYENKIINIVKEYKYKNIYIEYYLNSLYFDKDLIKIQNNNREIIIYKKLSNINIINRIFNIKTYKSKNFDYIFNRIIGMHYYLFKFIYNYYNYYIYIYNLSNKDANYILINALNKLHLICLMI